MIGMIYMFSIQEVEVNKMIYCNILMVKFVICITNLMEAAYFVHVIERQENMLCCVINIVQVFSKLITLIINTGKYFHKESTMILSMLKYLVSVVKKILCISIRENSQVIVFRKTKSKILLELQVQCGIA
jgi:hypothetical protein